MKLILLFTLFVAMTMASLPGENLMHKLTAEERDRVEFLNFQRKFDKKYSNVEEEAKRFAIFRNNKAKAERHNRNSRATWTEGVTKFSDMTADEFKGMLGYVNRKTYSNPILDRANSKKIDLTQLPASVDWRNMGAITKPKNQGSCGSCWAFAAAQMMESYAFLSNGSLVELSPQHITSCTPDPQQCGGTGGCQGSIPELAFSYTQLFGLLSEEDWPYTSGNFGINPPCEYDIHKASASNRGYEVLPRNDYAAVMDHLSNVGPLAVAMDASNWGLYSGGIFDNCPYNQNIEINHAVQLVGFGTDPVSNVDYWLVRNSWGPNWGEEGYIRFKREANPQCGGDDTPLIGTGCVNDGVEHQVVCGVCGILYDVVYPIGAHLL